MCVDKYRGFEPGAAGHRGGEMIRCSWTWYDSAIVTVQAAAKSDLSGIQDTLSALPFASYQIGLVCPGSPILPACVAVVGTCVKVTFCWLAALKKMNLHVVFL